MVDRLETPAAIQTLDHAEMLDRSAQPEGLHGQNRAFSRLQCSNRATSRIRRQSIQRQPQPHIDLRELVLFSFVSLWPHSIHVRRIPQIRNGLCEKFVILQTLRHSCFGV